MTDQELEQLCLDIESDRVERKESLSDKDKIRQAICAFANDLPGHDCEGVLFIGVTDKGEPTGLSIKDQLLQDLAAMRNDGQITPFPSIDVQKRRIFNQDVAVAFVYPSKMPPVRYKGQIWIRSGPRRGIASPDDERRLSEKRRFKDIPWDIHPLPAPMIELDELLFRRVYLPAAIAPEVLEQNQRSLEHQYQVTRFASTETPVSPTVLGLLTVGKIPTNWIPGAYVQFLRIDGTELGEPIKNQREVRGPLPDLLRELDLIISDYIHTTSDFRSGSIEIRQPNYPVIAIKQIVNNSILHRSYENTNAPVKLYWFNDRIEVHNPGGPYGEITVQNFGEAGKSDYRNPNLATVMKDLGYVQRFGMGITITRQEMQKNGNPPPEFKVEDSHIAVILRSR